MIDRDDWREIEKFVDRRLAEVGEPFSQGTVISSDSLKKTVRVAEFGDQDIPIIAFDYQVQYNYTNAAGDHVIQKTKRYSSDVEVLVPRKGDVVLIARQMGSRRLPKCLGVIKSKNYVGGND